MYDYPDYDNFYEPSEFDMMVEEFKDELKKSVSKEWVDRMNDLEEKIKSLREIEKNFNSIKKDYENKIRECEQEKNRVLENAKREAHKARLSELLGDTQVNYWKITKKYIEKPKCDKCDASRMIKYITPMGREAREYCSCYNGEPRYVPELMEIYKIKLHNTYDEKVGVWFSQKYKDNDLFENDTEYLKDKIIVDDDADLDEISTDDRRSLFFKSIEKCQEYCDYLNNKEKLCKE